MRVLARVLLGLGMFLIIAGVLAVAWAPEVVKKTPLDVDTTTRYEGQAAKIDTATGAFDTKPAYAIRHTTADSKASDDDTVIMVETACAVFDTGGAQECVNGNDPDLITASIDTFAEDRVTAEAVEDKNLPADSVPHKGLINKFPFDVDKTKTYCLWDGDVGDCVDVEYKGTKTLFGLEDLRVLLHRHRHPDPDRRGDHRHLRQRRDRVRRPHDRLDREERPGPAAVPRRRHARRRRGADPDRRLGQGRGRRGQDRRHDADAPADGPPDRRLRGRRPLPPRRDLAALRQRKEGGEQPVAEKDKVGAGA